MPSLLVTAETFYDKPADVPPSRRIAARRAIQQHRPLPPDDGGTVEGHAVRAYVNHGRWVADCLFCGGAVMAPVDDPRFLCGECLNRQVGGRMVALELPADRDEIEAELLKRPNAINRNWRPGETVDDLAAELDAQERQAHPPAPALDIAALLARIEQLERQVAEQRGG